jgi:protein SCO1/2
VLWSQWLSVWPCPPPQRRRTKQNFPSIHPFTLVDADVKPITSADFHGKWLLIYFGYTHCSDQCPTALSAMAEALDEIGPAADHTQPLFITVDPERDRGPMLRDFTLAFDKRLIGLTGTREQITDIARALGVKYEKVLLDNEDYVVDHSSTLSVIDPSGHGGVTFKSLSPISRKRIRDPHI